MSRGSVSLQERFDGGVVELALLAALRKLGSIQQGRFKRFSEIR